LVGNTKKRKTFKINATDNPRVGRRRGEGRLFRGNDEKGTCEKKHKEDHLMETTSTTEELSCTG